MEKFQTVKKLNGSLRKNGRENSEYSFLPNIYDFVEECAGGLI